MTNYIADISKTRWMASNPKRLVRTGMDGKPFRCPFCGGNEADTPPEVYRVGGGEIDKPGWQIRVVPNLFPITDIHEVIVHSPDHEKNIENFPPDQVENIIKTYINRFNFLKDKGKVFIFQNYSLTSGASLIHPHSQVAVVPNNIPTNTLSIQPAANIIEQSGDFVSYCPEYSEWTYEVWIAPSVMVSQFTLSKVEGNHDNKFENMNNQQITDLASILQSTAKRLKKLHGANAHYSKKPFGYNFYIYIPQSVMVSSANHDEGWYLRIIPRFMDRAGFEFSTGIMVNSVKAQKAAEDLKGI